MNLTVNDILTATGGILIRGALNEVISKISTDSRTICEDDLFVALIGERFDGHDFISSASQARASGAIVSKQVETDLPIVIEVKESLIALGDIAAYYRRSFDLPFVAITGSNGKTTTKDMITTVLSERFSVFQSEKNFNNQIGIPSRLLELDHDHQIAVLEIGTNRPGEIERLTQIVKPTVGVITNIGHSHLEFLGSLEGVAKEKGSLTEHVDCAVLNADDPMTPQLASRACGKITTFGCVNDADVSAHEIEMQTLGNPSFTLRIRDKYAARINLPCLGTHNISNALAASCVGLWAGLTSTEIRVGLENYQPADMRMQPIDRDGLHIINDVYNSNPDSLEQALEFLSTTRTSGKRIAVLGDMLELGTESEKLHYEAGVNLPENINVLISVGARSLDIVRGASGRVEKTFACETAEEAANQLREYSQSGDLVLIKGSRGMKLERIVDEYLFNCGATTSV
ncbi:MAG: UDP-N-acetylmuramoyl-tripeptide--D-alanyl-D-alanine ligase [Candidatus Poribacteria bacterium]|nr:UDP-N-acetylmuramoyl-tripeptide--D-alanyl-D-alanine ligase [Candidatus Poribacteria bacterium]MDE0505240.1 UDP-N-acetylmuramoyl-tripeptide--D-alanyl-D-alanine ligase [Candidatus Poribacteria bacterium]